MTAQATHTGTPRRALVTGGANGIGWAIARTLAARGMWVAIADLDGMLASARAGELGPDHVALTVDLLDAEAASALPARAAEALGGLDVIVNNAGMTDSGGLAITEMPDDRFARLVALNLTAVERICAAAIDLLAPGSSIVNLASGAAFRPIALRGPYSATKAGVVELTRALSDDFASQGVTVTAIAPGYTRTPLLEELNRQGRLDFAQVAAGIPLGRLATPEDIAAAVAFAAMPEAASLTGQTLVVDVGGQSGPAPTGAAPMSGTANAGATVVLGDAALAAAMGAETDLAACEAVATVIAVEREPQLDRLRDTARSLAALTTRARDFALVVVADLGHEAGHRAAARATGMLARTLALEWAPAGARVNAVLWDAAGRERLAPLCRFLGGADAGFVTGQVIRAGRE